MILRSLLCFSLFFFYSVVHSQTQADISFADSIERFPQHHKIIKVPFPQQSFFAKLAFVPYWVYKNFVSSQDMAACSFHPTCANYCINSIQVKGVFWGIWATFDRLCRCHNSDDVHYDVHTNGRWLDTAFNYHQLSNHSF